MKKRVITRSHRVKRSAMSGFCQRSIKPTAAIQSIKLVKNFQRDFTSWNDQRNQCGEHIFPSEIIRLIQTILNDLIHTENEHYVYR